MVSTYNTGEIYFIQELDPHTKKHTNFVKIGLVRAADGRDSFSRLFEHQTGNPRPLSLSKNLVVETPAVDLVEAKLHQHFSKQRIHGEWFEFSDPKELNLAVNVAREFALEVEPLVPLFKKSDSLKLSVSNSKSKKATPDDWQNARDLAVAKNQLKVVKNLEDLLGNAIYSAVDSGSDVSQATTTREINYRPKFLESEFATAHPKIYQKYLEQTSKVEGSFLLKVKIDEIEDLGEEFLLNAESIQMKINNLNPVSKDFQIKIVDISLELTHLKGICEWDLKVFETKLKISLGKFDLFEGICSWKRVEKTISKFNSVKFAEENPDLAREFVSVPKKSVSVKAKKVRA
jgi:hypothetical protein